MKLSRFVNHLSKIVIGAAAMATAVVVYAEPTRLANQELGTVAPADSISADLDYGFNSNGAAGGLRIGAFKGEVLVNVRNAAALDGSDLNFSNIGYKYPLASGLAVYGLVSYSRVKPPVGPSTSSTDYGVGLAYTYRQGALTLNVNPEILTDKAGVGRGGDTTTFVRGGVLYALPFRTSGRFSLLGEVALEDNDVLDTTISLGARWELRKNVTIDFVVYNDQGDNGQQQGVPGAVKVNIGF